MEAWPLREEVPPPVQVPLAQMERLGAPGAVAALRELAAAAAPAGVTLVLQAEKSRFSRNGLDAIAVHLPGPGGGRVGYVANADLHRVCAGAATATCVGGEWLLEAPARPTYAIEVGDVSITQLKCVYTTAGMYGYQVGRA